ncbi:HAD family hydrolase [Pseudonocardiaceae bacterium YIM PH 21723]|nr:HAD family hydrolase [Pseudonocardiaceae bacterium YIM PH 21723]
MCLDIDDTLLDNAAPARMAIAELLGSDDCWPAWRKVTDYHYARFMAGEIDFDTMRTDRTREFFADRGEQMSEAEVTHWDNRRIQVMSTAWRLYDDTQPCLEWLRSVGLTVVAVTNAASAYQRRKLAGVGLADAFDHLLIAEELGMAKPDPEIFHAACAAAGVHPWETVHVGDRLDLDAIGAYEAGLHGVWLNRPELAAERDTGQRVPQGVSVIEDLTELPGLIAGKLAFLSSMQSLN